MHGGKRSTALLLIMAYIFPVGEIEIYQKFV